MHGASDVTVVVRTVDGQALGRLLARLADGRLPQRVIIVDDRDRPRRGSQPQLPTDLAGPLTSRLTVLEGPRRGPLSARNVGWRPATTPWVAFIAEDAEVPADWFAALVDDLRSAAVDEGRPGLWTRGASPVVVVYGRQQGEPAPTEGSEPEPRAQLEPRAQGGAGVQAAAWDTVDAAYRRDVLAALGGFDERIGDPSLGQLEFEMRVGRRARFVRGARTVKHPAATGVRKGGMLPQHSRAAEVLLARLYGRVWRLDAGVPATGVTGHLLTSAALAVGATAAVVAAVGKRRAAWLVTAAAAGGWAVGTVNTIAERLRQSSPSPPATVWVVVTSPFQSLVATRWWLEGARRAIRASPWGPTRPKAVLFERSVLESAGAPEFAPTAQSAPAFAPTAYAAPEAAEAVQRLRRAGIGMAVLAAQPEIATGLASATSVDAANAELGERLGGVDVWAVCPHGPGERCDCRPPRPALVHRAVQHLGVSTADCVLIGQREDFLAAAVHAGVRAIACRTASEPDQDAAVAFETESSLDGLVDRILAESGVVPVASAP